nr:ArdC family protein [Clostridioides sp.]
MSNKNEKVEQLIQDLKYGLEEFIIGDKYKEYLNATSKFNNYSARNIILILSQNPQATHVASYGTWKKLGRQVKRGSKGLGIFVPMKFDKDIEMTKIDPKTNKPMLDKEGKEVKENIKQSYLSFGKRSVFDVSQTDGKELPSIANELQGDVNNYDLFFNSLKEISSVPIDLEDIAITGVKGYYSRTENRIAIKEGMSEKQTIKTAIHELSHAEVHNIKNREDDTVSTKEVEAESIAYIVCKNYGLDTSDYSFGYITNWNNRKDNKIVLDSLETIRKQSTSIIDRIDEKFKELNLEKVNESNNEKAKSKKNILDGVDLNSNESKVLDEINKDKRLFTSVKKKVRNNYEMEVER